MDVNISKLKVPFLNFVGFPIPKIVQIMTLPDMKEQMLEIS